MLSRIDAAWGTPISLRSNSDDCATPAIHVSLAPRDPPRLGAGAEYLGGTASDDFDG